MELVVELYRLTDVFPDSERFGLTSQIRRAAVSIPANIAEGYGRRSPASYAYFLRISKGSTNEIETMLIVAQRLGYAYDVKSLSEETSRIGAMLTGLLRHVEQKMVREDGTAYLAGSTGENEPH
ncbi:MAG: four helix bundle protein [Armatimonadetes bacterium]|nr:four helix bundle protein [Armatimonadota bacterium]